VCGSDQHAVGDPSIIHLPCWTILELNSSAEAAVSQALSFMQNGHVTHSRVPLFGAEVELFLHDSARYFDVGKKGRGGSC
jgi:hypothetical protein